MSADPWLVSVPMLNLTNLLKVPAIGVCLAACITAGADPPGLWPAAGGSAEGVAAPVALGAGVGCVPSWIPTFGPFPGVSIAITKVAVVDDGSGPTLIIAGSALSSIAGEPVDKIARLKDGRWEPMGAGVNFLTSSIAITTFDDGAGPSIYLGGWFSLPGEGLVNVARWTGASWEPVGDGPDSAVRAFTIFDDGTGPALYAAGFFRSAGGVAAPGVAKWDGTSWSPVGDGIDPATSLGVFALEVFDDGAGPALYAGGRFTMAGGAPANNIAKWDGSKWQPVGDGITSDNPGSTKVNALAVFDDGSGPALYVGGQFTDAGDVRTPGIARWDGVEWSGVGGGIGGNPDHQVVSTLAAFHDDSSSVLVAGGSFHSIGGTDAHGIAAWDGGSWSLVGSGVGTRFRNQVASVWTLATMPNPGGGSTLVTAGTFGSAGGRSAVGIALWDGAEWSAIASGFDGGVHALVEMRDGMHPVLVAAGGFTSAPGVNAGGVAAWDGRQWRPLGLGPTRARINTVFGVTDLDPVISTLSVLDLGAGPSLYAGGVFTTIGGASARNVARWDGVAWREVGLGLEAFVASVHEPAVRALEVFDDGAGPALYAGGIFLTPELDRGAGVARLDGASWTPIGANPGPLEVFPRVLALKVFDDGNGPNLFAGGSFSALGGTPAKGVARWDGSSWSPLGDGVSGRVAALEVFDDGTGPALYAGGSFEFAGGVRVNNVAKWDGVRWSPLGMGVTDGQSFLDPLVITLQTVMLPGRRVLVAGGSFATAGGSKVSALAMWDGVTWSAFAAEAPGSVRSIAQVALDHVHSRLYVAGSGLPSGDAALGVLDICHAIRPDLSGDGVVNTLDLSLVLSAFGSTGSRMDLTGDGIVDGADLSVILNGWGGP